MLMVYLSFSSWKVILESVVEWKIDCLHVICLSFFGFLQILQKERSL